MIPAKVATKIPFLKSNSLIDAFLSSSDISRSFDMPAIPATAMPARQTSTPKRTTWPETVPQDLRGELPLTSGGTRVPNAAVYPSATAIPSDIPR